MKERKLGNIWGATGGNYAGNVYDKAYAAPCLNTCEGGGRMPMIVEAYAVASRGRNPDNPSDRTAGIETEQRFEMKEDGRTNTITSVQKDNYAVITERKDNNMSHRIRKLTPTECFRLQGLTKEDADKCVAVAVSNTQLYRQAGNGIAAECVKLLAEHLFQAQFDSNYVCSDEIIVASQENNSSRVCSDEIIATNQESTLADVVTSDQRERERVMGRTISYCLDANYWKGITPEQFEAKKRRQLVIE